MSAMTRRRLLQAGVATALAGPWAASAIRAEAARVNLTAETRVLEVSGRAAKVFGLFHDGHHNGLFLEQGENFSVRLTNRLAEETLVHWHGLLPPSEQDGVPGLSQPALAPGLSYDYDFPLNQAGTFWMHSHQGLQEQKLLAAPLIVRDPAEKALDEQEVVLFLHDFSFREPDEIFHELRGAAGHSMGHGNAASMGMTHSTMGQHAAGEHTMDHGTMDHGTMDHGTMDHGTMAQTSVNHGSADHSATHHGSMNQGDHGAMDGMIHYNDIEFDAYLANDRTLEDPLATRVDAGGRIRLRIINAAAATNFLIDLGELQGELIAVDGQGVVPIGGKLFDLAIAQRLDIRLELPQASGSYPILARREADRAQTGILLATKNASIRKIENHGETATRPLSLDLERRLRSLAPLAARPADREIKVHLTGSHSTYDWGLDDQGYDPANPIMVKEGERVMITMKNETMMPHPMHLHGHRFQVVSIDGEPLSGALRDTVLVPPRQAVSIAFDADNPGHWAYHCHQLYHMTAGMMASVRYEGFL